MNDLIFCSRPHFLPVNCRKSRNNLFSILSRWISCACSATTSLGGASLRGRPLGRGIIPAAIFSSLRRSRVRSCFTTYLSLNPNCSAISRCVFPAEIISFISGSNTCTCVYPFLAMIIPPDVVLPFSYIRGLLVYCPFLLDLFIRFRGVFDSVRRFLRRIWPAPPGRRGGRWRSWPGPAP